MDSLLAGLDDELRQLTSRLFHVVQRQLLLNGCLQGCTLDGRYIDAAKSCRAGATCPVFWLCKPESVVQSRLHTSPFGIQILAATGRRLHVKLVCVGRHAVSETSRILRALEAGGRQGVDWEDHRVQFRCALANHHLGTVADIAHPPAGLAELRLTLQTPCQVRGLDLAAIAGNAAHDLVQWHLFEDGRCEQLEKSGCDRLAEALRNHVNLTFADVHVDWTDREFRNEGGRQSKGNEGYVKLHGFTGKALLKGDVDAVYPWLALLWLRGGGPKLTEGMGRFMLEPVPTCRKHPIPQWTQPGVRPAGSRRR